jgi:5'(3')-deoxyribonucleotidase
MRKPIIAVDVDDVLADSTEFWRLEVNKRANINLQTEHWRVPGEYSKYYERIWEAHGVNHLISIDDIDGYMMTDQSGVRPVPDAIKTLRKLASTYELVVITARNSAQETATRKWLDAVYPDIFDQIYFTWDAAGETSRSKGEICAEIGASWLIDDYPGHCKSALEHGVRAVLYGTYGWHTDMPMGVVHCKTWKDIEGYFDAI